MWLEHGEQVGRCQEVRNQDLEEAYRPWEGFIIGVIRSL